MNRLLFFLRCIISVEVIAYVVLPPFYLVFLLIAAIERTPIVFSFPFWCIAIAVIGIAGGVAIAVVYTIQSRQWIGDPYRFSRYRELIFALPFQVRNAEVEKSLQDLDCEILAVRPSENDVVIEAHRQSSKAIRVQDGLVPPRRLRIAIIREGGTSKMRVILRIEPEKRLELNDWKFGSRSLELEFVRKMNWASYVTSEWWKKSAQIGLDGG